MNPIQIPNKGIKLLLDYLDTSDVNRDTNYWNSKGIAWCQNFVDYFTHGSDTLYGGVVLHNFSAVLSDEGLYITNYLDTEYEDFMISDNMNGEYTLPMFLDNILGIKVDNFSRANVTSLVKSLLINQKDKKVDATLESIIDNYACQVAKNHIGFHDNGGWSVEFSGYMPSLIEIEGQTYLTLYQKRFNTITFVSFVTMNSILSASVKECETDYPKKGLEVNLLGKIIELPIENDWGDVEITAYMRKGSLDIKPIDKTKFTLSHSTKITNPMKNYIFENIVEEATFFFQEINNPNIKEEYTQTDTSIGILFNLLGTYSPYDKKAYQYWHKAITEVLSKYNSLEELELTGILEEVNRQLNSK